MSTYVGVDRRGDKYIIEFNVKDLANAILQIFKINAPVRTGTLQGQVRLREIENGFEIISDIYYMQYTEEKWGYHSGWKKTLVNPNEGWWQEAFQQALQFLSSVTGKEMKRVK